MSAWTDDALWLAPHLCTRLRDQVPTLRDAFALDEFDVAENAPRQFPAAVVLLDALRPPGSDPMQRAAVVELDWLVLLAVRSSRRDGDRASQRLGPLVSQVVRALQGWVPPDSKRAFAWRRGPRPDYGKDVSYFPLLFTIQALAA